jgi:hypothetical protein
VGRIPVAFPEIDLLAACPEVELFGLIIVTNQFDLFCDIPARTRIVTSTRGQFHD